MFGLLLALVVWVVLVFLWAYRWDRRTQPQVHRDLDDSRRERLGL
jgi:hypothetical protein